MRDAVLEIGMEEIPAGFLPQALIDLKESGRRYLKDARICFEEIETCGTPRRLTLFAHGVAEKQGDLVREVKGPARRVAFNEEGNPTKAACGFARAQGIQTSDIVVRETGQGEYVYAILREEGRPTVDVLREVFPRIISALSFPKSMRWGDGDFRFARPIRWILALYGADVVGFEIAGIRASNITYGHRFLSKGSLDVADASEYFPVLAGSYVVADHEERCRRIKSQAWELARNRGARLVVDRDLLDEVADLVEYPTAFLGKFDPDYLLLPRDVLITAMQEHQRYFPVEDESGKLLPFFIAVRNGPSDEANLVARGNEKVLKARLADARFFFEEDRKTPLAAYVDQLRGIILREDLGTVYDKVRRVTQIARELACELGLDTATMEAVERASLLCKADLVTHMVREFPELQGAMGREYARLSREKDQVADAIFEHYLPRHAGDGLPETIAGAVLAVADKLDTVVSSFGVGITPTGSQDPYGLRRQGSGIVSIAVERDLRFSLPAAIDRCVDILENEGHLKEDKAGTKDSLLEFFKGRVKASMADRGGTYDLVDAVIEAGFDFPPVAMKRFDGLMEASRRPDFPSLVTCFTRAANISGKAARGRVDQGLFCDPVESELFSSYLAVKACVDSLVDKEDYAGAILKIAELWVPIDRFFLGVLVMAEDPKIRENRLALLSAIASLTSNIADLSKVVISDQQKGGDSR